MQLERLAHPAPEPDAQPEVGAGAGEGVALEGEAACNNIHFNHDLLEDFFMTAAGKTMVGCFGGCLNSGRLGDCLINGLYTNIVSGRPDKCSSVLPFIFVSSPYIREYVYTSI